jgi:membrane peptidoglycan carboxypeptidase
VQDITNFEKNIFQQGIWKGHIQSVIEILDVRFNHVPEMLVKMIQSIEDTSLLTHEDIQ